MFLPGEGLLAVGAGVWGVAHVLPHVLVEVFLPRERTRTVRALVRSLARMLSVQSTFRLQFVGRYARIGMHNARAGTSHK